MSHPCRVSSSQCVDEDMRLGVKLHVQGCGGTMARLGFSLLLLQSVFFISFKEIYIIILHKRCNFLEKLIKFITRMCNDHPKFET